MPEMDGLTPTSHIRGLGGQVARIPIIAMTANAMRGDETMRLEAGMNGYISKPIDRVKLAHVLSQFSSTTTRPTALPKWYGGHGFREEQCPPPVRCFRRVSAFPEG